MKTEMKKMTSAAQVFELLQGCSLGAISACARDGTVRLIVEGRERFAAIPDSWGRVMIILTGCSRFACVAPVNGLEAWVRVRPRLGPVSVRDGVCEVSCSSGLMRGVLRMDPSAMTLVLGGGRKIAVESLRDELDGVPEDERHYSCAG